ncbi:MAG: exodeoxyribonuclease V subunit gamma [Acidimicrobiia bacterium]|nr:exodeoxyribonuclease V subunit gamma [Acidimicrobiia bacterium]
MALRALRRRRRPRSRPHDAWQPHLWRLTRARLGEPSPPERVPALLEALRAGALDLDLPPRLSVFGVTTLPGGESFLDLVAAVSAHRDVHVFLLDPSPAATARVREAALATPPQPDLLRADDRSDDAVLHPLLRSWGRPCRERTVLLTAAEKRGMPGPRVLDAPESGSSASATSLLARIQHDLRADTAPAGDFVLRPDDRSVQVYSCHGEARQVEALRDAILHLLADDPRLSEDDVVVLCPAIERFAPLVEAGFGSSVGSGDDAASGATPRLLYHVTDRSLRQAYPVVAALDALLELISGRCTVPEMLDFLSLAAVRERLGLDDDSLAAIGDWAVSANVRWGLDAEHRASWGLPPEHTANSWRAAVDRLLMGVAVSDDGIDLAPGGVAALGVEGDHIAAAGLLADAVMRLSAITADSKRARTAREWCGALTEWTEQLFAVDASQEWQFEKLRRMIADIGDLSIVDDEPSPVELTLADVRRLLADRLQGDPRRPDLFRGGITISSLTPLRWIPFRVVCLLGLDEAATASGSAGPDGDDLTATAPRLGDGDTRSEARQSLLEAVLAAGEHLVVTRTGHDVRNNREVPYGVAAAELRDVVVATLAPGSLGDYHRRIDTSVPRQPFDARCFTPGALGGPGAWSFDSDALEGARARAGGSAAPWRRTGPC